MLWGQLVKGIERPVAKRHPEPRSLLVVLHPETGAAVTKFVQKVEVPFYGDSLSCCGRYETD